MFISVIPQPIYMNSQQLFSQPSMQDDNKIFTSNCEGHNQEKRIMDAEQDTSNGTVFTKINVSRVTVHFITKRQFLVCLFYKLTV